MMKWGNKSNQTAIDDAVTYSALHRESEGGGKSHRLRVCPHFLEDAWDTLFRVYSDTEYLTWAASQRRPVERLHCLLFVLGSWLVFDLFDLKAILSRDDGSASEKDGTERVSVELLLVALHVLCLFFLIRENEKWKHRCSFAIRLVAVVAGWSFLSKVNRSESGAMLDAVSRYMEGALLRVVVCQVRLPFQVFLSAVEIVGACWVAGDWKPSVYLAAPFVAAIFLECSLVGDYDTFMSSNSTERVYPKGATAEPVPTPTQGAGCVQEAGGSGSGVRTSAFTTPPSSAVPGDQRSQSTEPTYTMDLAELFKQKSASNTSQPSLIEYKPVVAVRTRTIKVFNKDATEAQIQRYAEAFASSMASTRKENGKLTVVKGIGVRGCILLMAGVMDKDVKGVQSGLTDREMFDEAAQELISCLPADLRGLDMDVTVDGVTGRFVEGQLGPVSIVDHGADLPEVVLVSEPCAVMNMETNLDICLSESNADWKSVEAVLVLGDEVLQKKELDSNSVSFRVHGSEERKSGYIRTVGVTKSNDSEKGTTIVSSIAPFLQMPKAEAQELNGLFDNTVLEAVKNIRGSTYEQQRKAVWKEHFKPFALDMQYIMGLDMSELHLLGDEMKSECHGVFANVVGFLKECNADQTCKYLERVLNDAMVGPVRGEEKSGVRSAPSEVQHNVAGPSDASKPRYNYGEGARSDIESSLEADVNVWRGFRDPALEAQYKLHISQNLVLADFVGIIMGLCLLPIMWQSIKDGEHLYLCPLMTHFVVCTSWFLLSERTYVHSRQPVVVLLWIVRMAVFVGQVACKGWHTLVVSSVWNMAALSGWFVLVKPRVMKMALSDFVLLSVLDLACWLGIVVISFICEDVAAGVKSFGLALFCVSMSCMMGYFSEKDHRNKFAKKKPSSSK
ncbi:hypothetical protein BSKO_07213 [Bryopsis sp. KO-2023]|nr:hypothetical protein BSKO_07213 [Bryopsis sp. KO-2023]